MKKKFPSIATLVALVLTGFLLILVSILYAPPMMALLTLIVLLIITAWIGIKYGFDLKEFIKS